MIMETYQSRRLITTNLACPRLSWLHICQYKAILVCLYVWGWVPASWISDEICGSGQYDDIDSPLESIYQPIVGSRRFSGANHHLTKCFWWWSDGMAQCRHQAVILSGSIVITIKGHCHTLSTTAYGSTTPVRVYFQMWLSARPASMR